MYDSMLKVEDTDFSVDWSGNAAVLTPKPLGAIAFTPSVYGERRINPYLIALIIAAHMIALGALMTFKIYHQPKVRPEPLVVSLIPLQAEPPVEQPQEKMPDPAIPVPTPPVITAPPAIVSIPQPAMAITAPAPVAPRPVATPPAPPAGPVSVDDLGTRMISATPPRYPMESRRRKEQGEVVLSVTLGTDGSVIEVALNRSSGFDRLDKAALEAVRKWRWAPTIRSGEAVKVRGIVDIPFVLKV